MKDRVSLNYLSLLEPPCYRQTCHLADLILPSMADDHTMKKNFTTLVSRIITKNMPFFNTSFSDVINWHIKYKYYSEMSKKSEVVSDLLLQHIGFTCTFISSRFH